MLLPLYAVLLLTLWIFATEDGPVHVSCSRFHEIVMAASRIVRWAVLISSSCERLLHAGLALSMRYRRRTTKRANLYRARAEGCRLVGIFVLLPRHWWCSNHRPRRRPLPPPPLRDHVSTVGHRRRVLFPSSQWRRYLPTHLLLVECSSRTDWCIWQDRHQCETCVCCASTAVKIPSMRLMISTSGILLPFSSFLSAHRVHTASYGATILNAKSANEAARPPPRSLPSA